MCVCVCSVVVCPCPRCLFAPLTGCSVNQSSGPTPNDAHSRRLSPGPCATSWGSDQQGTLTSLLTCDVEYTLDNVCIVLKEEARVEGREIWRLQRQQVSECGGMHSTPISSPASQA